jgi:predicted glutamine amidotransferase
MCNVHIIKPINKKLTKNDINQMVKMLDEASLVNPDGWGVFTDKGIYKESGRFIESIDAKKIAKFKGDSFIIGHNRYTTHGKNTDRNSHPFKNERLVWVHNGVLSNFDELKKKYFDGDKMNVDSEIIGAMILKKINDGKGIVKAIKWTASKLQGTFSIFIYDKKDDRLFYFREGYSIKIRLIRQKIEGQFKYIIVGSTNKENIKPTYKSKNISKYGFDFREFEILSSIEPEENTVYEIGDYGLKRRGIFSVRVLYDNKPKVKMSSVYGPENKEDKNKGGWKEKIFGNSDGVETEDKNKDSGYYGSFASIEQESDDGEWVDEITENNTGDDIDV